VSDFEVVVSRDRPDLENEAGEAFRENWPEFIFHDPISNAYVKRVEEYFEPFNVMLLEDGAVVAGAWGVPLRWDGTSADLPDGYDGGLVRAVDGHEKGVPPDTLSVMAAAVRADRQRGGLAGRILTALRDLATAAGLRRVICPVRPTTKIRYPLTSMADFATWTRDDGLHIDPWIRTHQRLGATILGPAERSMVITGSVADWEGWAGMVFPQTGDYVLPQALDLLHIDRERDEGRYVEPNLWMRHL
jgi:GNAT superfamily N-acetyltransferase